MKILLIHQYAGNKGDRAVAYSLIGMLREMVPDAEITLSTSHPELWDEEVFIKEENINLVPGAWDFKRVKGPKGYWRIIRKIKKYTFTILRESYLRGLSKLVAPFIINPSFRRAVKSADYVISVGGHHFTTLLSRDLVSSINYDAMAALTYKPRLTCFSQSFGPFEFHNPKNKKLTRKILTNSDLFPREGKAVTALRDFGISDTHIHPTYETVLWMSNKVTFIPPTQREKICGIAIYATQSRAPEELESYIKSIAGACDYLISSGYQVRFFPMELKGSGPDDRILINKIIDKIEKRNGDNVIVYDEDMSTFSHIQEVAKCQMFIGHKTHSTIFALSAGTPLIGIAYHPKTREFMKQFGVEDACVDDKDLTSSDLIKRIKLVELDLDSRGEKQYRHSLDLSKLVQEQLAKVCNHN